MGFYFFLQPLELIIGGMMGIGLLLEPFIPLSVGFTYLILNLVALLIGGLLFGKDFFVKNRICSILSPLLVTLFEVNVNDTLIISQID